MAESLRDLDGRGRVVSPTQDDPLIAAVSEVVGGKVGRYRAAPDLEAWSRRAVVVSIIFAVLSMLGALWLQNYCRLYSGPSQVYFTHLCYSDITAVYGSSGLVSGVVPFLQAGPNGYLTQPVGTGAVLFLLSHLTPDGVVRARWFFDLATILLTACLIVSVICIGKLAGRRAWDAAILAASPVVVFSGLISLDLLAVALGLLGLLCFARARPGKGGFAGVLLGLAVAVRPFEIVLLLAILIVAERRGRLGQAGPVTAGAVLGWLALNLPVALVSWTGWTAYLGQVWRADLGYGSLLLIPQILSSEISGRVIPRPELGVGLIGVIVVVGYLIMIALAPATLRRRLMPVTSGWLMVILAAVAAVPFIAIAVTPALLPHVGKPVPAATGRVIALIGYPVVVIAVLILSRRSPRPPRVATTALLLGIGWLLVSPAMPVQTGLWLLPLLVASLPSWRLVLGWGLLEALYTAMTWLYLYGVAVPDRGAPGWLYIVVLLARVAMLVVLAWRAWTITSWPEEDVIRRDVGDDPAAGPLLEAVVKTGVVGSSGSQPVE